LSIMSPDTEICTTIFKKTLSTTLIFFHPGDYSCNPSHNP
jgi:hypothetical protein